MEKAIDPFELNRKNWEFDDKLPVLVCTQEDAKITYRDFFRRNKNNIHKIKNNEDVYTYKRKINNEVKYLSKARKASEVILRCIERVKVGYEDFEFSLSDLTLGRKASSNLFSKEGIIYIKQDGIQAEDVVHLLSYYDGVQTKNRPSFVFEPDTNPAYHPEKLNHLNEKIHITYTQESSGSISKTISIDTPNDFILFFLKNAHSICKHGVINKATYANDTSQGWNDVFSCVVTDSLRIKSHDYSGNKFEAMPLVSKTFKSLKSMIDESRSGDMQKKLLALYAIMSLWNVYIDESQGKSIDNALKAADYIGSDFLKHQCHRLSHLFHGVGKTTSDLTRTASNYFLGNEHYEYYVYSKNNHLLNSLNFDVNKKGSFVRLSEFIVDRVPYIDRMSIFLNNTGVACLLNHDLHESESWLKSASRCSGQPIHHIGIEVNLLLVRYIAGEMLSPDVILTAFRRISRANLPAQYNYHQSYLFWNLYVLSGYDQEIKKAIFSHLKKKKYLPYDDVLRGKMSMVDYLAQYMGAAKKHGKFMGPRGEFIHRVDAFPVIHYAWM